MGFYGFDADPETFGDFFIFEAGPNQLKDFLFPFGERFGAFSPHRKQISLFAHFCLDGH